MTNAGKLMLCALLVAGGAGIALAASRPRQAVAPVTFSRDVAPIVFAKCAACHHPNGPGPFSLLTYEDVKRRARLVATATESRYMPPWLAEPGHGDFADDLSLSAEQIATIRAWVDGGAVEGSPSDLPPAPKFSEGWQLGEPDLVVKMPLPYALRAGGPDVFRNFVLPVPIAVTRYVKAIEILPGDKRLVHHANVLVDRTGASRRRDAQDPEVGFGGMDLSIESDTFDPDSHFLFWKPGSLPRTEPEGMAWRLDPGDDLVLNMHMQPSGKPEAVRASIGIYFADAPPTKFPMLVQLEHDGAIDIPPGTSDFLVSDDFTLPVDVDVLGVYPHAHYIGKDLRAYATLPDGTKTELIRIARWDLNWQAVYRYKKPVFLPKGTVVSMRYTYDNSAANERNPNRPPKRVVAGNNATDEMGHLWLQVLPRSPNDVRIVLQEALMRRRLEKYPTDFSAHFNLGSVLQSTGRLDEAAAQYDAALAATPDAAIALNGLGTVRQQQGRTDEALGLYLRAIRSEPDDANARYNAGVALLALERPAEAAEHFRAVLRARPNDAPAHTGLGSALQMAGDVDGAAAELELAVRADPDDADARASLGILYEQRGDLARALTQYEEALRIRPNDSTIENEVGILYAKRGDLERAAAHFEAALRADPTNAGARSNLEHVRSRIERKRAQNP